MWMLETEPESSLGAANDFNLGVISLVPRTIFLNSIVVRQNKTKWKTQDGLKEEELEDKHWG